MLSAVRLYAIIGRYMYIKDEGENVSLFLFFRYKDISHIHSYLLTFSQDTISRLSYEMRRLFSSKVNFTSISFLTFHSNSSNNIL